MRMMRTTNSKYRQSAGFTLIELILVITITGILTAVAVPQMLVQRRLTRSTAVTRDIMTQMRYARQLAMSQASAWPLKPSPTDPLKRVAYTFQYDDVNKQVKIIGPIPAGKAALLDITYPYNGSLTTPLVTDSLTQGGLTSAEISYGIPTAITGLPAALDDGVAQTALASNVINITFQPDGSVIDSTGIPLDRAMFIYNNKVDKSTASAISVIGASGRVKVWRYSFYVNKFVE